MKKLDDQLADATKYEQTSSDQVAEFGPKYEALKKEQAEAESKSAEIAMDTDADDTEADAAIQRVRLSVDSYN